MRKFFVFLISALFVTGCGGGSDFTSNPVQPSACSNDAQKQYVLDALYAWYLWNDLLPAGIDIADYATPESLVYEVTTTFGPQDALGNPVDLWSSVGSAQAVQQFYGEGEYEGFGFSWREEGGAMRMRAVYSGSPADLAGFARGQTVLTFDGRTFADIQANEGINAFFDDNSTIEFEMLRPDSSTFSATITKAIVTIDPIPQWRTIDIGPGLPPVGYMEFRTFISTADPVFDQVFAGFIADGVEDVIIDLRYNGGGLVPTAELLGDYLGGFANDNLVFSNTEFNADRAAANNSTTFFSRLENSIDVTRIIVIASRETASASELVANALDPYADVWIVGDNTYGKPVGQVGFTFCEKMVRPTAFRTTNADGVGDYFDGLPVDCPAADLLEIPVGADNDPNVIAAVSISETGACPAVALPDGLQAAPMIAPDIRYPELTGPPEREFAGAY